jgi:hypothetical protein
MRLILSLMVAIALTVGAGSAIAGCGKKVTDKGTLKTYDATKKTIVVVADGKEKTLTVTPATEGRDKIQSMVGKNVTAISEHSKLDSVKLGGG